MKKLILLLFILLLTSFQYSLAGQYAVIHTTDNKKYAGKISASLYKIEWRKDIYEYKVEF